MLATDEMIARLVDVLQQAGELENTYVFFASDNGFELGEHRYTEGKGLMYEESIRVPLLVRGPGVPAGRSLPHATVNVDLLPTWVDLAGGGATGLDGRSLAPLLGASPTSVGEWRSDVLVEFLQPDGPDAPPFQMLRTPEWAYAEYLHGEREMYDMVGDPFQLENVGGTAPGSVVAPLSEKLGRLKTCAGNCE
jgi:arylsulfatase A-like enzyme